MEKNTTPPTAAEIYLNTRTESDEEFLQEGMQTLDTSDKIRHSRAPYTVTEDRLIMKWILGKKGRYMEIGGRDLWKQAEKENVSGEKRTWQSLKERFMKHIVPYLGEFIPDEKLRSEILTFMQKRRTEKIRSRANAEVTERREEERALDKKYKQRKKEVDYDKPPGSQDSPKVTVSEEVRNLRSSSKKVTKVQKEDLHKKKNKKS